MFTKKLAKVLSIFFVTIVVIFALMTIRTFLTSFPNIMPYSENAVAKPANFEKHVQKLSGGLQFQTVGNWDAKKIDIAQFAKFRDYLRTSYPTVFKNMEYRLSDDHAMLLIWRGTNPDLKPILFNAFHTLCNFRRNEVPQCK